LFCGGDGQESDFCEPFLPEFSETNPADDFLVIFQDDHRLMIPIEDQLHDILLGHFGELPGENVLQVKQVFE